MSNIFKKAIKRAKDLIKGKIVLPSFEATVTCAGDTPGATERTLTHPRTGEVVTYHFLKRENSLRPKQNLSFNRYPVVINQDGSQWSDANLYLLWRVEKDDVHKMKTLWSAASDLGAYKRFLDEEQIDYLEFPSRDAKKPTYRYFARLNDSIQAGDIAISTAKRRMNSVVRFYTWLMKEKPEHFLNAPFKVKEVRIRWTYQTGAAVTRTVQTTNLSIKSAKAEPDAHAEYIEDDGKLYPLSMEHQTLLVETLVELGHTEMTLIHLLALYTGGRIQTILTLRARDFSAAIPELASEIRLPIGPGRQIDTKNSKLGVLYIPIWLYEKVQTYLSSDRYKRRLKKVTVESDRSLIFLSRNGNPLYDFSGNRAQFNAHNELRYFREGGLVRVFIAEYVLPKMRERIPDFNYRFHDLRASFGMNLADAQNERIERKEITYSAAMSYVQARMGHESFKTTERYIGYRERLKSAHDAQTNFEKRLKELTEIAKNSRPEMAQ
ncbi:site-specific integrase [Herbaspirillum sp. LeCh32-8]|uniref:site-specific integrase n=1 Tax=Herbaspirillum sp. LeCh32-8 TaxID=2821356 RepID=UPI001AE5D766|nr:site-specific integrase [Herbaspirillum sp. LeCh32-8]MBP0598876.1 site-specific integrase [Herbaspirillum sp. LeCh32-8]